jgi:hypothetical protein
MEKSLENFEESVRNIRTGSVTSSFIDTFKIHYFGQNVPIKHLAYTANEKGLVVIKPYDLSVIGLIEKSLKEAGLTLETVMESYNKIKSESELEDILEKNGSSFDDMYHYFFMVVENSNGSFLSKNAMVHGIRRMPFDTVAKSRSKEMMSFLGKGLTAFFEKITSTAEAQGMGMNGGGFTTGIVMVCTCDANVLTFQLSFSGGGSGLYSLSPGFMPNAGSGRVAGPWLGGYQMMSGQCKIYAVYTCITIPANVPVKPVGYAF